ncbi:hypothetical protein PoB_000702500 [Plakobranchus ocellatus]|uniref:Transposase Tc1-like domain-containing protein n=1 Tax=Plakobranchus ocellatus TaxID=259542 RepID=A0AAV3YCT8_9GAST|nr:hypothetical protein PoB_000702500 [Plakobranchus ocellatus]
MYTLGKTHTGGDVTCNKWLTRRTVTHNSTDNLLNKTGLLVPAATVSRILRATQWYPPFPYLTRVTVIRAGCYTQRIALTLQKDESHSQHGVLLHQKN